MSRRRVERDVELVREKDWPSWAESGLQGVAFWIGHRRAMYPHYPLSEGALVAELCNLIAGKLSDSHMLKCEVMYATLLGKRQPKADSVLTERARADLVVARRERSGNETPIVIIEVKRLSAGDAQLNADLRRLAEARRALPGIKSYLFVIAEAQRPDRFVSVKGSSKRGMTPIPGDKGHYRVRRTFKAAHAFERRERAQYCCLVEVFGKAKSSFQ